MSQREARNDEMIRSAASSLDANVAGPVSATRVATVAQHLATRLVTHGVSTVFGIPGVHNQAIYDALLDQPRIQSVITRHEQGSAFMADGYARVTGRPGVCVLISGPGVTNAATALAEAYADSSPVIALATTYRDTSTKYGRRLHDMRDQTKMLQGVVKEAIRVNEPTEILSAVDHAFVQAATGRPGPVVVELPLELLDDPTAVDHSVPGPMNARAGVDERGLDEAFSAMSSGRRPVVVVGGGASDASVAVRRLAEALQAPVVSTTAGKGILPADHYLNAGAVLRTVAVKRLIAEADPLILLGTEWSSTDLGEAEYVLPAAVVRVNHEEDDRFSGCINVQMDVGSALDRLNSRLLPRTDAEVGARVRGIVSDSRSEPRRWFPLVTPYIEAIEAALADDAIVVNDMNTLSYGAADSFESQVPRSFLAPKGYGTLGFALPAALGARFALPSRQVVAIVGDGGLMFSFEEVLTAARYRQNLPIVVWNNESFGAIRYTRNAAYGRTSDDELMNPDFVALGSACRGRSVRVSSPTDLEAALRESWGFNGPTIIEVVSPELSA